MPERTNHQHPGVMALLFGVSLFLFLVAPTLLMAILVMVLMFSVPAAALFLWEAGKA